MTYSDSVSPPTYFIRWRFVFLLPPSSPESPSKNSQALIRYYAPKWATVMNKLTTSHKLSRSQMCELPMLRRYVTSSLQLPHVIELLSAKNKDLARLLVDAAFIFNISPVDLKCHILAAFGVSCREFQLFIEGKSL